MGIPKVAIVGRPNVGKSALFNRIAKRRIAIVDEAEGITRDRLYYKSELFGKPFELIDTGGIHAKSEALFNDEVKRQAEIAIEEADSLILVVDGMVGATDLDKEVARIILRQKKPVCLAVNKIDAHEYHGRIHEFYGMGVSQVVGVSATHGYQIAELMEIALDGVVGQDDPEDDRLKVAIVGRPNVGKSTMVNTLLGDERCIVSPIAGTTRDSIDTVFENFTLIDTAGIRRKRAEHEVVDKFAAIRTKEAIERADVCVLVLDAQVGMTSQDKKIATRIEREGKGCVLLFNKWDLVKETRMEHCLRRIREEVSFLGHCPVIFGSAEDGRNLEKVMAKVVEVGEEREKRVTTGVLNSFIEASLQKLHPPMLQGRRLRIYYMTQVSSAPPRFLMFVNKPELMAPNYKRYLQNRFRDAFGFTGNPIRFELRGKKQCQGSSG